MSYDRFSNERSDAMAGVEQAIRALVRIVYDGGDDEYIKEYYDKLRSALEDLMGARGKIK